VRRGHRRSKAFPGSYVNACVCFAQSATRQCAANSPWERARRCDAHDERSESPQGSKPRWCDSSRMADGLVRAAPARWRLLSRAVALAAARNSRSRAPSARGRTRLASNARKCSKCSARTASGSRKNTHAATWRDGANVFGRASRPWKRKSHAWTIPGTLDHFSPRRQDLLARKTDNEFAGADSGTDSRNAMPPAAVSGKGTGKSSCRSTDNRRAKEK
jgi:hypothetical protein